jgi:hypothetical protein
MTHPEPPGEPGRDVLERAPRRWSPSRLAALPRWLQAVVAALVLAGGATAIAVSQGGPGGRGARSGIAPAAQVGAEPGACRQFVNITSFRVFPRYRIVLGDVAVPPAQLPPLGRSGLASWPYGQKTGFQFRGHGPPVTIMVPDGWRGRVALFGIPDEPHGMASTLRIPSCPPALGWNTYVSAFYTHSRTACVPLRVQVGPRTVTVWFGLGRRCLAAVQW